jgi:hypothetical protein
MPGNSYRTKESPVEIPVRRTVMAMAAVGVLFASACGQDDSDVGMDRDSATPAAHSESASVRRSAKSSAADIPAEGSTTTTADSSAPATTPVDATTSTTEGTGGPGPSDEAASEVCGEDGADIAPLRGRPADAPAECIELGTGDVQVTLRWSSPADVDLHVTEPDGSEISYQNTGPTSTGGELDVDSNVGCNQEASVENVFWPVGQAPSGTYTIEVVGYQVDDCGSGSYTVTAKVRGEDVLVESGTVGEDETDTYHIEV